MTKLEDFIAMLDPHFSDPLTDLKRRRQIDENLQYKQLNRNELKMYIKARLKHEKFYKRNWLTTLINSCSRYKNPCLINLNEFDEVPSEEAIAEVERVVAECLNESEVRDLHEGAKNKTVDINKRLRELDHDDDVYVGVALCRPGRHTYVVRSAKDETTRKKLRRKFTTLDTLGKSFLEFDPVELLASYTFSMHRCLIPVREEEVPSFFKTGKSKINQRVFRKEYSVFRDWREDNPNFLNLCFKSDSGLWKLHKFIKDPVDLEKTIELLKENFVRIKKIFLSEASKSGFPCINWIAYSDYCALCKLVDQNCNLASIDRAFIATNVELEKHEENPATALERYEFMEILVRIA